MDRGAVGRTTSVIVAGRALTHAMPQHSPPEDLWWSRGNESRSTAAAATSSGADATAKEEWSCERPSSWTCCATAPCSCTCTAHAVFVLGRARRGAGAVREGERHRRRQNAEHISQREQSPCRRSSGPGKPAQHRSFHSSPPDGQRLANLGANRAHAKCLRFSKCSVLPGAIRIT
jgi:hypothetical protein